MNAASIRIECEEDGFHLIIDGDSPDLEYSAAILDYRIQDIDLNAFYDQVKARIGPYLQERDEALAIGRGQWHTAWDIDKSIADAYDRSDPKHPDYHDSMSAIYDSREGK